MQLGNAPKTHFWRICPEGGEKGSRERLKRLAEVLPDNTWNKTSLKIKNVHIGLTQHCGKL